MKTSLQISAMTSLLQIFKISIDVIRALVENTFRVSIQLYRNIHACTSESLGEQIELL